MSRARSMIFGVLAVGLLCTVESGAQQPQGRQNAGDAVQSTRTMRPVIRGRSWAVSTMKAEATRAAEKILLAGGNAFDAAVAAQAVLG